jgi:transposase-like protein
MMMRPAMEMDERPPACTCPHLGGADDAARYGEMVEAEDGHPAAKKFRCKTCGREWNARAPE